MTIKKAVADIKSQLFNPALTSHFQCWFSPPRPVIDWINQQSSVGYGIPYKGNEEFFSIACSDASLPGSSLMTHEQNNDFHGITERFAYRRDYGSGTDFTFIVDNNHNIIFFFENWIRYIVNERHTGTADYPDMYNYDNAYSRVNYPKNYISPYGIFINKFEKDYDDSLGITYQFINAYPISITSMPVSYEASQLLKCTVTFVYTKYIASPMGIPSPGPTSTATSITTSSSSPFRREDLDIWALTNSKMINSVGTPAQRSLLASAKAFYSTPASLAALKAKAVSGGYTAGTGGLYIGKPIPSGLLTF